MNRRTALVIALLALASGGSAGWASAQAVPSPRLVVSYVEVPVATSAGTAALLGRYAATVSANPAHPTVELLQEIGRPQRLAVIERWPGAPADTGLERALAGKLQAPLDRRDNNAAGALMSARQSAPFHMLMHVDVVPAGAVMAKEALEAQRAAVLAAPGGLAFELAVQTDRTNHFAVHETWSSRAAYEAYAAGPAARALRDRLATVKGALFDDRFFKPVATGTQLKGKP